MIDIHAHILPDMDDGARSWAEAAEMAETAAESGTHTLAATIHANLPGMDNPRRLEIYTRKLEQFQRILLREKIPLTVCSGMEVFADASFPGEFRPGDFLTAVHTFSQNSLWKKAPLRFTAHWTGCWREG